MPAAPPGRPQHSEHRPSPRCTWRCRAPAVRSSAAWRPGPPARRGSARRISASGPWGWQTLRQQQRGSTFQVWRTRAYHLEDRAAGRRKGARASGQETHCLGLALRAAVPLQQKKARAAVRAAASALTRRLDVLVCTHQRQRRLSGLGRASTGRWRSEHVRCPAQGATAHPPKNVEAPSPPTPAPSPATHPSRRAPPWS